MKSVCQEDYTVMQQIFVDICQHILTHSEAIDWFFYPIREKEGHK